MLVSGCAVGPDFQHPPPPEVARYTPEPLAPRTSATADARDGQAQHFVNGRDIPGEWWRLFRSPPLNSLVQEVADRQSQSAGRRRPLCARPRKLVTPRRASSSRLPRRTSIRAAQQQSGSLGAVTSTPATLVQSLHRPGCGVLHPRHLGAESARRSNCCRRRRITSASWSRPPTSRSARTWSWRRSRRRRCGARSRPPTSSSTSIRRCWRSCAASSWRATPIAATSPPRRRRWPRSRRPCRRCASNWRSSAIFFPHWPAGFRARSRWRPSSSPDCSCRPNCRSACRRSSSSSARTCAPSEELLRCGERPGRRRHRQHAAELSRSAQIAATPQRNSLN